MKFVKIKLKNFKPYYDIADTQEILFFDEENKGKNISLNIGQTGSGKTSISEAIMWCLFGENYRDNWEELVNTLSIAVAKQRKENELNMSVELLLEKEGEYYRIIRNATYDINKQKRVNNSELSIIHDGILLIDSIGFIGDNFPTITLMKYFIFDADDILKKFEENREKTIKDHINKLVGVEKLDNMINSLEKTIGLYDNEIYDIESQIQGDIAKNIEEKMEDIKEKEKTIRKIDEEIKELDNEKKQLFKVAPSPEEKRFSKLVDNRNNLQKKIYDLNKQFIESKLIPNIDLILLEDIINESKKRLGQKHTSKAEFEASIIVIKSTLSEDYSGVFFDEKEAMKLIKKGAIVRAQDLDKIEALCLESGEGIKTEAMKIFQAYEEELNLLKARFKEYKENFKDTRENLLKMKKEIKLFGETAKEMETKEKVDTFSRLEKKIEDNKKLKNEIQIKITSAKKEIRELREQLEKDEKQKKEIKHIEERKKLTKHLFEISKKVRKDFLNDLLSFVNNKATEFLRNTVKDTNRFNSIEIDSNYQFRVKQKNGKPLEEIQINRGNLQISMMSFFFGLSKFIGKEIPYIIDDPLLRLDPGHDKRLIDQLSKTKDQLVFHMIPGKEYTGDSFSWLKPYINTQNWIYQKIYMKLEPISYIERKDADIMIEFDIDKF